MNDFFQFFFGKFTNDIVVYALEGIIRLENTYFEIIEPITV